MFTKKFIGWVALVLFVTAVITLALLILLRFIPNLPINAQFVLLVTGKIAFGAAILGFYAFNTNPGRIGAVGGFMLTIAVMFMLLFTTIARVERGTAQQPLATSTTPPIPSATVALENNTTMPAPITTQMAVDTQTYHNSTIGFELDYPSGWLIDTNNEASGTVILWSKEVESPGVDSVPSGIVKIDIVNPVTTVRSLDELVEWQKQIIADSSHEILNEKAVRLPSGLDAVQLHLSGIGEAMALLTMINEKPLILVEYGDLSHFTEVSQTSRAISLTSQGAPAVNMLSPYISWIWLASEFERVKVAN